MTTTIYRAANHAEVRVGYSFSEDREVAEAYLRNPGFGGETLYAAVVELADVLDLTDAEDEWTALSDASGIAVEAAQYQHHFARVLATSDEICAALAAAGYHWVRISEDYPAGAVTIIPVSEDAADEADSTIDECA